ncbi:MAG: IS66 family insertion sequence element accessory protein TnpB [Colwellia sp.]|nr:IS66 family insertion sequence element accessory protein TnpB [Colwellia sp.]
MATNSQTASSGLQIAAFCKQQKITLSSFYAWRKRLASQSPLPSVENTPVFAETHQDDWVGITPEPMATSSSWDIELSLPNGVVYV